MFPPTLMCVMYRKMRKLILVCHHNLHVNRLVWHFKTSRKVVAWIQIFLTLHHGSATCFVFSFALNETDLEKKDVF